jgi:hypothetical protein
MTPIFCVNPVNLPKMDRPAGILRILSPRHANAESVQMMAGSVTSVFGEPADFLAALRAEGLLSLLVSGPGEFRARLTQIGLHDLRLSIGEERLSRVAVVVPPMDKVLVALAIGGYPSPTWGGVELPADELITLGPGQRVHVKTEGPCQWGVIGLSNESLNQYGSAILGSRFVVPPAARWRPRRGALNQLRRLQRAAIARVKSRSAELAGHEAAHGLEQQLIHALIDCLSSDPVDELRASRRREEIIAGFENRFEAEPSRRIAEMVIALGVSLRTLQDCCNRNLGMGPGRYIRLLRAAGGGQDIRTPLAYSGWSDGLV